LSQVIAFDHWCIFNAPFVKLAGELVVSHWLLVFSRLWPFGGTFLELTDLGNLGYLKGKQKSKCKIQNCGGPSGGFILKKKKTGSILWDSIRRQQGI